MHTTLLLKKVGVGAVTICAAAVFAWSAMELFAFPVEDITPAPFDASLAISTSSLPVRLQVPSLGINAAVQYVGITSKGTMAVPTNSSDVGWYRFGPAPGEIGSAVVDGHVDNGFAFPGVFRRLKDVEIGEAIYVLAEDGTRLAFTVENVRSYYYTDVPTDVVFGRHDAARLNLISCTGKWIRAEQTYDHRIVVFAKLVSG